jgi:hypothetical protein
MGIQQYIVVLETYLRTRGPRYKASQGSEPVPHHKLTPTELLPPPTVARHDADIVADSSVGVVQVVLQSTGKVDDSSEQ